MFSIILSACVLAAVTMWVHAAGIAVLLRGLMRSPALQPTGAWSITRMLLLHDLVADPAPSGGDFDLGVLLFMARRHARCRIGVLLFRSYLHGCWLRRSGAGEAVAAARTDRELGGRPHVRLVHGLFLRYREPHLSIAIRGSRRRLHRRKDTTVKPMPSARCEIGWLIL